MIKNDLITSYVKNFGNEKTNETQFFSAFGRVELCGNHTDHNGGVVLASTINLQTCACVLKTNTNIININSCGYKAFSINLNDFENEKKLKISDSYSLVCGILQDFFDRDFKAGGFNAVILNNIPQGAGVSSSASFEVLICKILNALYNQNTVSKMDMSFISQFSENNFLNKPCGLLDQTVISYGGINYIDFKEATPKVQNIKASLTGLKIYLVKTNTNHTNLSSEYGKIRVDMAFIANIFNEKRLIEINYDDFKAKLPEIKKKPTSCKLIEQYIFMRKI